MNNKYFSINREGCSIRCTLYYNDLNAITQVVLCCHGFGGNKENKAALRLAQKVLHKRNDVGFLAFDWPCHGRDARKKLDLDDCDRYLTLVTDYARSDLGAQTLFVFATSFGAYLTLKYISEHENPFCKIALRSAAVRMFEVLDDENIMTLKDRESLDKGKDVLVGFSRKIRITKKFADSLIAADITKRNYLAFSDMIILIHGTKDEIVPIAPVREFAEENGIPFFPIENADHRFVDSGKMEEATMDIVRFFWPE